MNIKKHLNKYFENRLNITLKKLSHALEKKDIKLVRQLSAQIDEQDLANWIAKKENKLQAFFLRSLDNITASEVFNLLDENTIGNIINTFTEKETKKLLSYLYSDDIVDILEDLPSALVERILKSISPKQRKEINYILNYPDKTVGSEMNVNFISLKITDKISDAVNLIRSQQKNKIPEEIQYYYVTDDRGVLIGYVYLSDFIFNDSKNGNKRISSIMETDIVSVRASENKEKALEKIKKYQKDELPVVDQQNKLIGTLNVEQVFGIIQDEHSEDISRAAGIIDKPGKSYFRTSSWKHFCGRFPWLMVTLVISTISQAIFSFFLKEKTPTEGKDLWAWVVFIIPFLPFIFATVGNVALQSTAIIVKNITLDKIKKGNYWQALFKEIKITSFTLFFILIINVFRIIAIDAIIDKNFDSLKKPSYWTKMAWISFILFYSVLISLFFSAGLPILSDYFSFDPALVSSPLLTTLVDLVTMGLALWTTYYVFDSLLLTG